MNAHNRTLLTVICEAALEHKLEADLKTLGAPGWTLSDARGSGSRGVRSEHLQARYYANFAMVCYLAEVEVLRPEKF